MIYYHDPILNGNSGPRCFRHQRFTHLSADTETELLDFGQSIGLKPEWLQKPGTPDFHFDVVGKRLSKLPPLFQVIRKEYVRRLQEKWRQTGLTAARDASPASATAPQTQDRGDSLKKG